MLGLREREAPPEVLRQLREIHPSADMFWVGDRWWVGKRRYSSAAAQTATERIAMLSAYPDSRQKWEGIRFLREVQRGFRPTTFYQTEFFGSIVADFRRRVWYSEHEMRAAFEETMRAQEIETSGPEVTRDKVQSMARGLWHRMRGRFRRGSTIVNPYAGGRS